MFIDFMEMIISERYKYGCDTTNHDDLFCRACEVTKHKSKTSEISSVEDEEFEDTKHITKGISPFVGQMFGYMHS